MSDESDEIAEVIRPSFGDHFERPDPVIDEQIVDFAAYRALGGDWTAPPREVARWPWTELDLHPIHEPVELEAAVRALAKRSLARGDGALTARLAENIASRRLSSFTRHFWFEPDLEDWQPTPQMRETAERLFDDLDELAEAFDAAIDRQDGEVLRTIELTWLAHLEEVFDECGARNIELDEIEDSEAFTALLARGPVGFTLFGWGTPGHPLRAKHRELFAVLENIALGLDAHEWIAEHAAAASDPEVRLAARFLLRDLTRMRDRELTLSLFEEWKSRFGDAIYIFTQAREAEAMLEGELGSTVPKLAVQFLGISLTLLVLLGLSYLVIPWATPMLSIGAVTLILSMLAFLLDVRRVAHKYERER